MSKVNDSEIHPSSVEDPSPDFSFRKPKSLSWFDVNDTVRSTHIVYVAVSLQLFPILKQARPNYFTKPELLFKLNIVTNTFYNYLLTSIHPIPPNPGEVCIDLQNLPELRTIMGNPIVCWDDFNTQLHRHTIPRSLKLKPPFGD